MADPTTYPRAAKILHILNNGESVSVECEVESYDSESNLYWVDYTDPEDEQTCIYDSARPDELTFFG